MNLDELDAAVADRWKSEVVPQLIDYIRVPALSPAFDPDWASAGHLDEVIASAARWVRDQPVGGCRSWISQIDGRTPVLVVEVDPFGPDAGDGTVLLYGHLDKQPEMTGWREGLGPWTPVVDGDRLYGRGGADDGYAVYASMTALAAVQAAGGSHPRCVVLIETSEESGSPDLVAHIDALAADLGRIDLVICLDSGCATFDRLWVTSSLRGLVALDFTVEVMSAGQHSGAAGGMVPSTFAIARELLDRVENAATGEVLLEAANVEIPAHRQAEAHSVAQTLGMAVAESPPMLDGVKLRSDDPTDLLLNKTWRPALEVIGAAGLPSPDNAGNVLRPSTTLTLSLRVPPAADPAAVVAELTQRLTTDVPFGAHVSVTRTEAASGWDAPEMPLWLTSALAAASEDVFGQSAEVYGEGGSIPFMAMLGDRFPDAQFVITGVLGPETNAHGPNEFLHVSYATDLTRCIARVIDATAADVGSNT